MLAQVIVQREDCSYVEVTIGGTRINTIDFVTIASTGNATDFGDHTDQSNHLVHVIIQFVLFMEDIMVLRKVMIDLS